MKAETFFELAQVVPSVITMVLAAMGASTLRRIQDEGLARTTHSLLDEERATISDFTAFSQDCETMLVTRYNEVSTLTAEHKDVSGARVVMDKNPLGRDLKRLRTEASRHALRLEQQVITDRGLSTAGSDYAKELASEFKDLHLALFGPSPMECSLRLGLVGERREKRRDAVRDAWLTAASTWRETNLIRPMRLPWYQWWKRSR